MPNLFPITENDDHTERQERQVQFGRSWRFDYEKGDFVTSPTGKVMGCSGTDAWLEWCKKAILTKRYRHLVYSRNHGQELDDLISRHLTREANELEIKRMVTETLMVDPRTSGVGNFTFRWEGEKCFFTCEITNVRGEKETITESVVI